MKVKAATGGKLNWSKQVKLTGYAKHLTEDQRINLVMAMNKVGNQLYTWPDRPKK